MGPVIFQALKKKLVSEQISLVKGKVCLVLNKKICFLKSWHLSLSYSLHEFSLKFTFWQNDSELIDRNSFETF